MPTVLALWLIGLGIDVIWNPPRQPQKNGVVERSQGTAKRWSEPDTCTSAEELQARLDADDRRQRDAYPSLAGRSRSAAHPELRRPAPASWRRQAWSLTRVLDHLAGYVLPRRVDQVGNVSVYGRNLYVGKRAIGRTVYVTLDPHVKTWIVADEAGTMLKAEPAGELTASNIKALRLFSDDRRRRHAAKLLSHPAPA